MSIIETLCSQLFLYHTPTASTDHSEMGSILGLFMLLESLISSSLVYAGDSHRLNFYFSTTWSPKESTLPHTQIIAFLDDVPIIKYPNSNRKLQRLVDWLENVDPKHWEALEESAKYYEQRHQSKIQRLRLPQNYTNLYIYQVKFGCWINEDNSTGGEEEFGAHGRDFLILDNEKKKFMASVDEAMVLAEDWNSRPNTVKRQLYYRDKACIQWLQDYLHVKTDNFPKNVHPEVKVWGRRQMDGVTRLQCLVYGFHPRPVDVKWVRNGEDHIPSDEMSPILPHPDGTYQIRVSVEVPTREGDAYSCHVDHSSLSDKTLCVNLEAEHISSTEKGRSRNRIMLFVAVAVCLSLAFIAVYIKITAHTIGCST